MEFIKELLMIQHEKTLHQLSSKLFIDELEKELFIDKYNKRNYCLVTLTNRPTKESRVKPEGLISTL